MSRTFHGLASPTYRSFRVHYREYLRHKDEPGDENLLDGASKEIAADLIRTSFYQKRRLRRTARRLRYAI
jgi:hypothetical protein